MVTLTRWLNNKKTGGTNNVIKQTNNVVKNNKSVNKQKDT